jgi:hypothetical protein
MCFSASASFIAAGCLGAIGSTCMRASTPSTRYFAAVPLLFAVQQLSEGVLWIALANNYTLLARSMPYVFLFFAFFLWPILLPYSLYEMETEPQRKHILAVLSGLGLFFGSTLYGYVLIGGVSATIVACHLYYALDINYVTGLFCTCIYMVCTVGAGLVTSRRAIHVFAILVALSYAISHLFYYTHLVSVWCFFAAILSACVYWIISHPVQLAVAKNTK